MKVLGVGSGPRPQDEGQGWQVKLHAALTMDGRAAEVDDDEDDDEGAARRPQQGGGKT